MPEPTAKTFDPRDLLSSLTNDQRAALTAILCANDPLLNTYEAAQYLGVTAETLYRWQRAGAGPGWIMLPLDRQRIRYRLSALNAFATAHRQVSRAPGIMSSDDAHLFRFALGIEALPFPSDAGIDRAAAHLGVAIRTLRRWDKSGKLAPTERKGGRYRRYDLTKPLRICATSRADGLVKIGEAARLTGVSTATLRRWEKNGMLLPVKRTDGSDTHRRPRLVVPAMRGGDALYDPEKLPSRAEAAAMIREGHMRAAAAGWTAARETRDKPNATAD